MPNGYKHDPEKYKARKAARAKAAKDTAAANGWKPLQDAVVQLQIALGVK